MTKTNMNDSVKWISLAFILVGMIYGFGAKSKELEKDDFANSTAIGVVEKQHTADMILVRDDLKEIKSDVKKILSKP